MRIIQPDFARDFRCIAGACPDSCCRQGWQIDVDPAHRARYDSLPGALGARVRAALTEDGLRMENGVCALLEKDGLCPIVTALGEDGLCDICRTHPRFLEQYGGVREIHFSLSCPEAARLALARETPIAFYEERTDEPVTTPNEIDPDEYTALLHIRRFAIALMQQRRIPLRDRLTLLLTFAGKVQKAMDERAYWRADALMRRFRTAGYREKLLHRARRLRLRGASFLPELTLLRKLETLTAQFPAALHAAAFTAKESRAFDAENATAMEHMTVLWLAHYVPKAVNDGRADTKLLLAAFLTLTARRLCVCTGMTAAACAGLLAKEIEHSEENIARLYAALENSGWARALTALLEVD